jgi:hypothetical protein
LKTRRLVCRCFEHGAQFFSIHSFRPLFGVFDCHQVAKCRPVDELIRRGYTMASDSDDSDDFIMDISDGSDSDCPAMKAVKKPTPAAKTNAKGVLGNAANTKPKATAKKPTDAKKPTTAVAASKSQASFDDAPPVKATVAKGKKKTVEETLRPDTYIGSTQPLTEKAEGKKGKQQRGNDQDFAKSSYWDTVKENAGRKRQGVKVKTTVNSDNELRVAVEAGS